jgi:outer membrane protein TolC
VLLKRFFMKPSGLVLAVLLNVGLHIPAQAQDAPPAVPFQPLDSGSATIRSYVESAATNSWRMDLQDIMVNRAEAFSVRSSASKRPTLNLNADLGYQLTDNSGRSSEGINYRYNLSARKSLYSWGAVEADHQYGLLGVKRAKQDRQLAFLSIYRDVIYRYIDMEVARQKIRAESISVKIQQEDVELRRAEVKRGEYPETQFAGMELNYDRSVLRQQQLELSLRKAEDSFREIIGVDESVPLNFDNQLDRVPNDLADLENQVKNFIGSLDDSSVKVLSKKARLDQELERLKRYEVNQRPKVNGLLRLRRDTEDFSTGTLTDRNITETFAGLEFNWNIYDGRSTSSLVMETLESRRQLERELEIMKKDIIDNLEFLLDDLRLLKKQVDITEKAFGWEAGEYGQVEKDVNAGRLPQKSLEIAKRDLESERIKQMDARAVFYKSLTDLYVALEAPSILAYLEE